MQIDRPVVSVVVPVLNGERFLREAVESILDKTFRDSEFINIDDRSTDGTPRYLIPVLEGILVLATMVLVATKLL